MPVLVISNHGHAIVQGVQLGFFALALVPFAIWVAIDYSWLGLPSPSASILDPVPFAGWTILLAGLALYRQRPRHALAVIVLLAGSNITSQALKVVLAHNRWHEFLHGSIVNRLSRSTPEIDVLLVAEPSGQ